MNKMTLEQVRDWHRQQAAIAEQDGYPRRKQRHNAMTDAIDAELKARGEPAAYLLHDGSLTYASQSMPINNGVPLYTAPPPPKIEVRDAMVERALRAPFAHYSVSSFIPMKSPTSIRNLMRAALEAALKETP